MNEASGTLKEKDDPLKPVADILFSYLRDIIYKPSGASLNVELLPDAFADFGKGLQYLGSIISETRDFAKELAVGNLNCAPPPPANEIASPLKMLHSSLRHLTWQTQQVAKGDYNQRVNFMGDFSLAFNNMVELLEKRRKINLDEIAKLEMYVSLILVNCPNPILLFDSQGKLAYVSDSFFRHCKIFERDEVLGSGIHELFAPIVSEEALDEIENLYRNTIAEKRIFDTEQKINFGSPESSGHFNIQITPMLDPDGNVTGILLFLLDMTESIEARIKAEQARELAEQSSRSKSNFLARMSHEIRTPMNAILGMAELALRENVPPLVAEHIRTIRQAGINLLSIINDILDFSKIEAGKLEIVPVDYSFSSLVHDVVNIIKTKVVESRLRFAVDIDCNIPNELNGDVIRIRQVFLNLLSNAVKYTEKGFVSFSVRKVLASNDTVKITAEIADSGKGIRQEEQWKLFSEFSRFDAEKNINVEGTGLGLAICQSLVTAMGGEIDFFSEYGKGSTFMVSLPQKVRDNKKIAAVLDSEKKSVLIYERRQVYLDSLVSAMANLGVNCKAVVTASDYHDCLVSRNFPYVILASALYEEIKKKYADFKSDAKIAVITEFGETIADRNVSTITMPTFSLPIASFLNGVSDRYSDSTAAGEGVKFTAPEAKVLVVDDINTNLIVVEGLLTPYGMQVKLCKSGMEAIEEIKTAHYDLVLMDNMMPEMDGTEAMSNIRAMGTEDPYYKNVPIVALTSDAIIGTKERLIRSGFDDFLTKPIDTTQLNAIIERWIPKEKQTTAKPDSGESTTAQSNEIEIEGLDIKRAIKIVSGSKEKFIKMLTVFHKDGTGKLREIKACLENNSIPLYTIHVHALKSASAFIGADALSRAAAALEDAGKKADMEFIHANNGEFMADLEALLKKITAVLPIETGLRT